MYCSFTRASWYDNWHVISSIQNETHYLTTLQLSWHVVTESSLTICQTAITVYGSGACDTTRAYVTGARCLFSGGYGVAKASVVEI